MPNMLDIDSSNGLSYILNPECLQEGSRRLRDTDAVTIGSLIHEFESNGMVEASLNGHKCARPEGAGYQSQYSPCKF